MTATATKPRLKLWPHPTEGAKPVPAFEVDGTTYYHYPNDLEARTGRIMASMDIYREMEFNCTRKDLEAYLEAVKVLCNKGDLMQLAVTTNEFQKRVQWISNLQLLLKLASVLYFDETEDPNSYDAVYCDTVKIPRWEAAMRKKELPAFFFRKPIRDFLPFSAGSEADTLQFSSLLNEALGLEKERSLQLYKSLSSLLSSTSNNKDVTDYLASQVATLTKQMPSYAKASTPTA